MQNQTFNEAKKFAGLHGRRKLNNQIVDAYTMWTKHEKCVLFHMNDGTVAAVSDDKNFARTLQTFVN